MLLVVPLEKLLAKGAAVLDAAEAIGELRTVLHGSKLAFRIRVVVGNIGSAVALGDTQVGHQKGHRLGLHDPAAVGVDGEVAGGNRVLADGLLEELRGQFGTFPSRHHPAGDVAAENIQDDIQIVVRPLDRTAQLGDVPAPKLVGAGGQQLRFLVSRMNELIAALARFSLLLKDAIYGANRAEVPAFIQEGSLHGCRRAVLEALFMEDRQYTGAFGRTE